MGLNRQRRRTPSLLAMGAMGAAVLAGQSLPARAGAAPPDAEARLQNVIVEELELADAPLATAVKLIKLKTPVNLVMIPSADGKPYGKVTVSLKRRPVAEVLELIAASAGADLWQKDGVYFVGPKGSAPKDPAPIDNPLIDLPEPVRPQRYEVIKLQYLTPSAVKRFIVGATSSTGGDLYDMMYARFMRYMVNPESVSAPVGVAIPQNYILQNPPVNPNIMPTAAPAVPVGQTPAPFAYPQGGNNNGSGANLGGTNGASNTASLLPTPSGDQSARRSDDPQGDFGRGGQFPGGGGGFPGGGGGGGLQGGGGGLGGGLQGGQGGLGGQQGGTGGAQNLLPSGIQPGDIIAVDGNGQLILGPNARPEAIPLFRELIRLLDVKPYQIMVRAEFVTLNQNDQNIFGINWQLQRVNLIAGFSGGNLGTTGTFLQYASGNVQTQLSWVLTQGRAKLVAAPMATTLNNVPVNFFQSTQIPVFLSTPVIAQNGTVALAPQLQLFPATTGIAILPRVNGDGTITLLGTVLLSDVGDTVTGPNGETAPIIVFQNAPIQRILRNGESLVIAGLTRKNETVNTSRVPLLGDLPLIGTLFRSRQVTTSNSDLIVFITASVIPERGGTGLGSYPAPGGPTSGGTNPLIAPPVTGPGGNGNP